MKITDFTNPTGHRFPFNVFEDIEPYEFDKHNKTRVTEDFVSENFKDIGWSVFRPFIDTGIDLIVERYICPKNHTNWDEIYTEQEKNCKECDSKLIKITRFIQVKTREVKGTEVSQKFGFTLKSKDFRNDPRHTFLLYSDRSLEFLIIPIYEYLKIFYDNLSLGKSHFQVPTFRYNNNKQNSLRLNKKGWHWVNVSFNQFVNEKGLSLMMDSKYDLNFEDYIEKISNLKLNLFSTYSKGRQATETEEQKINNALNLLKKLTPKEIIKIREKNKNDLITEINDELKRSIEEGYFIKFKELKGRILK